VPLGAGAGQIAVMRILFFGAHFPRPNNPTIGVWALSQMTALRDAGHDVRVISPIPAVPRLVSKLLRRGSSAACPPSYTWENIDVSYVRWPLYPVGPLAKLLVNRPAFCSRLAWFFSAKRFLSLTKEFAPQVVFAHHGQLCGLIAAEVSRRLHVPFFITEHSFVDIESCATNVHRRRYYRNIVHDVSAWIAVSNRMEKAMLRIFPGVPTVTVHNGGERVPAPLQNLPKPARLAGCFIVLCACFFYKRKQVPLLIDAFDAIAERHPNARLVIIGSGEDQKAVTAAANAAAHAPQIILCGQLSHIDVLQYIAWCDVFANVAVQEPFATVFADAMMAGKPIIFSADCGIADVAKNEIHGLSVEPGVAASASAALDLLMSDSALRIRLGAAAQLLARTELTWATNASRMSTLFELAI
jgi:glycosyltransferase involved in cell wall biosynthesis